MPGDIREPFRPRVGVEPLRAPEEGYTPANTSRLNAAELATLNGALCRLAGAGLSEQEAERVLDAAVRDWLTPADAAAEAERGLSRGRPLARSLKQPP